jgi:hypothetical protein
MTLPTLLSLQLPIDLANLILEFSGYHKFRDGQYVKQIDMNSRLVNRLYQALLLRPLMKNGYVILHFTDENCVVLYQTRYNIHTGYNSSNRIDRL